MTDYNNDYYNDEDSEYFDLDFESYNCTEEEFFIALNDLINKGYVKTKINPITGEKMCSMTKLGSEYFINFELKKSGRFN